MASVTISGARTEREYGRLAGFLSRLSSDEESALAYLLAHRRQEPAAKKAAADFLEERGMPRRLVVLLWSLQEGMK